MKTPQPLDPTFEKARAAVKSTVEWMTKTESQGGLYNYLKRTPFERSPAELQKTYAFTANPEKNRTMNFPLYDKTRVRLKVEQELDNNYINASYVSCPPCDRKWIVTQHPMEKYYEDFWKMVFYEEIDVIVGIFGPQDNLPTYFPTEKGAFANHGGFFVHCWKITPAVGKYQPTNYTIEVLPHGCSNSRMTSLLHYPHWPKGQIPQSPKVVLKWIQSLDLPENTTRRDKCLIHSADGINRPLCFIMVDYMVEFMFRNNIVDIPELITQLKCQRNGAFHNRIYVLYALFVAIDYVKIRLMKHKSAPDLLQEILTLQNTMKKEFSGITTKEPGKSLKTDATVE